VALVLRSQLGELGLPAWLHPTSLTRLFVSVVQIYVIALLYQGRSSWWPLVPGVIFLLLGFRAWRRFRLFLFSEGWPLILVIVGGLTTSTFLTLMIIPTIYSLIDDLTVIARRVVRSA